MKLLTAIFVICLCHSLQAERDLMESTLRKRIYTPEVVVDSFSEGVKGAVQLLWQKSRNPEAQYEIQVSNGVQTYTHKRSRHFHHIMIYFNKDYQWRVREVSDHVISEFGPWRSLKVVKADSLKGSAFLRESASVDEESDAYMLDTGE